MTDREKEFLELLRGGTREFKQQAAGIFKNLFGTGDSAAFSATRVISGGLSETDKQFNTLLQTRAQLLRSLGEASFEASKGFTLLEEESLRLFGSTEKAKEAQLALNESMRSFAFMSDTTKKTLGTTTMVLDKFGVSMSTTGDILDSAAMAFGMSQTELQGLATELATVVYRFPGQASDIARNFKQAQSSLAYDSTKLMQVFKGLQNVSSTTGVSFSTLTSKFGESMDTFEGSANKAGTLNAILGRSVFNSIDLLGKTEAERVDTIVKGVRSSIGGDVNRLGKFQLKAVADGLGLTPEETRRLLSGQTSVDQVVKGKEASDPRTMLQKQANKAMDTNTMTLEALTTEMKLFRSPLENLVRQAETATRRTALEGIEKIIREFGPQLTGVSKEDINKIALTSVSDATDKLLGMLSGISPLINDPEVRRRIRAEQQSGATSEENNASEFAQDIMNRVNNLGFSGIAGQIATAFKIKAPEKKTETNQKNDSNNSNTGDSDTSSGKDGIMDKVSKAIASAFGTSGGKPMQIEIVGLDGGMLKALLNNVPVGDK